MSTDQESEFRKQIAEAALRACRPICWHDRRQSFPKTVRGASCFFLKFRSRCVGVTAAHVVRQFLGAKLETPSTVCQLQLMEFDLNKVLIAINDAVDIATFAVSENDIRAVRSFPFDVSSRWPSAATAERGALMHIIGYPEEIRVIDPVDRSAIFQAYGAFTIVEDTNDRDIITIYDPAEAIGAPNLPPLGFNMSGCSGGPAVVHEMHNGVHRWYPVGLIVGGPAGQSEGSAAEFDMIRIRRIEFIGDDGSVQCPDVGWLPR